MDPATIALLINVLTPQAIELVLMARRRDGSVERVNLLESAKTNIDAVIERSKAWRDRMGRDEDQPDTTHADPPED